MGSGVARSEGAIAQAGKCQASLAVTETLWASHVLLRAPGSGAPAGRAGAVRRHRQPGAAPASLLLFTLVRFAPALKLGQQRFEATIEACSLCVQSPVWPRSPCSFRVPRSWAQRRHSVTVPDMSLLLCSCAHARGRWSRKAPPSGGVTGKEECGTRTDGGKPSAPSPVRVPSAAPACALSWCSRRPEARLAGLRH